MSASLKEVRNNTGLVFDADRPPYMIIVCGLVIGTTMDAHHAAWMVRRLNAAKEETKHNAMNILIDQLGYSDEYAMALWEMLKLSGDDVAPASWHEGNDTVN